MKDITKKLTDAREFLNRGGEDYAILSIIQALEILATPEPETATEQLLQRYRGAAALRVDEIFTLKKERDLAQKALNEACQGQIELAHTIKVLMAERDEMISDAAENLAHFIDTVEMEEKYKKERNELRELLRELYPGISAMDLRRKAAALLPDVEFTG